MAAGAPPPARPKRWPRGSYWTVVRRLHRLEIARLARRAARRRARGEALPPPLAYRKLFIVGCPRSGTTWVQSMLARHPLTLSAPESHAYDAILGTFLHMRLRGWDGWRRVLSRYDRGKRRKTDVGLHYWIPRAALCRLVVRAVAAHPDDDVAACEAVIAGIFDRYFVHAGGTPEHVLVEKTPPHIFWSDRILARHPDARIVEVLRDGRDVCVSMEMRALTQTWAPRSRREQAGTWARYVRRGLELRSDPRWRDRILVVRYEDVHADPEAAAARLFAFVGLDTPSDLAARIAEETAFDRHARTGPGRHNRKGVVGDWRNHMSAEDLAEFREVVGDLFTAVGYRY